MKEYPILLSDPIPFLTFSTSTPRRSQIFEISFIKEIFVASMELAAYFVISASLTFMRISLSLLRENGAYNLFITFAARLESTPTTILSGFKKSFTAAPSFKNSGFETTSNSILAPLVPLASNCF